MRVQYRLLKETAQFTIDSDGNLRLTAKLDRESVSSYRLGVLASRPPLTGFTEVHVTVVDVNDCPPRFQSQVYQATLPENTPEGTSVLKGSKVGLKNNLLLLN